MGDGTNLIQGNRDEVLLCIFLALADCFRNLGSLTKSDTDMAILITDNDQSRKPHVAAALDRLGDSLDGDYLLGKLTQLTCINIRTSH